MKVSMDSTLKADVTKMKLKKDEEEFIDFEELPNKNMLG